MFERYTEKARRVIFFARYEASEFGSPYIETEHILLGIVREDKGLTARLLQAAGSFESIRQQIEKHTTFRDKTLTSVDLPLSNEGKRVLAYAAEEAERLSHNHIGPEHLLLGLLREDKSFAAVILTERGVRLERVREELARGATETPPPTSTHGLAHSFVAITSMPAAADIEVDGVFLGHTPAELLLPVGIRALRITRKGHEPWERTLTVVAGGRQSIMADLEPSPT
jgi:ATP-dependent Clp protease ATP-binding subunit ClpA